MHTAHFSLSLGDSGTDAAEAPLTSLLTLVSFI